MYKIDDLRGLSLNDSIILFFFTLTRMNIDGKDSSVQTFKQKQVYFHII